MEKTTPHTPKAEHTSGAVLPLPPRVAGISARADDMEIYVFFMRHLRHVPCSRAAIKVLSAIQFTADILDCSDAHVAKVLVELGLRTSRMAFPADFLRYVDAAMIREGWQVGGPTPALKELGTYWRAQGESPFAAVHDGFCLSGHAAFV